MATKPKTTVETKQGTKVHNLLSILLEDKNQSYSSFVEAARTIGDIHGEEFTPKMVGQSITWFNEGIYRVDGVDVFSSGKIDVINPAQGDITQDVKKVNSGTKTFEDVCAEKGIDPNDVAEFWSKEKGLSYKMKRKGDASEIEEWNRNIKLIQDDLEKYIKGSNLSWKKPVVKTKSSKVGVLNIADIHLGAFVKNVGNIPDYNTNIVRDHLDTVAARINSLGYSKVYVNILGDLIDCFENLMHENQWKEIQNGMYGANVIKFCTSVLHEFLGKIDNLEEIQVVAGNHDRNTRDRGSDVKGTAADLISWGLKLLGYKVNFDALIISKEIDGINYVLLHGDKLLSKRSTKELAFSYGKQGMFNFVLEGHLHSRTQKAQLGKRYENTTHMVSDDAAESRRQIIPAIFSGNTYAQQGGWDAQSGFIVVENNGNGKPNVFDFSL